MILDLMTAEERTIFETYLEEVSFPAGVGVMRQGDPNDGCYVIDSGTARVEFHDAVNNTTRILGYLEVGSMVGEMSMIGPGPVSEATRSAAVYAHTDLHLRRLPLERFSALEQEAPAVSLAFARVIAYDIAQKLRQTNPRLANYIPIDEPRARVEKLVERAIAEKSEFASPWAAKFLSSVPTDVEIIDAFLRRGINTVCMVADSILASMDQYLMDLAAEGKVNRWVLPSERSVPAVAIGRWLATGEVSLMTMQNSGFSNAMDYLRSIMLVHQIPGIVMASWRGFDALLDNSEPHILLGQVTQADTVTTLGADHVYGERNGIGLAYAVEAAIDDSIAGNLACIRVSPPSFKKSYPLRPVADAQLRYFDPDYYANVSARKGKPFTQVQKEPHISRDEALTQIHEKMKDQNPFYIVGNGFNPRAMQALRLTEYTFENAGGMGSSLAIAWGAAKSNPAQTFVAIDGDQNAVMNEMEKVLSFDYPPNLYWFILNNGIGESVGPSLSLPLSPCHYELGYVINTRSNAPGDFQYDRINNVGRKFDTPEAKALAEKIGNLPAQAQLARQLLAAKRA
jgi:CRP-like cAMP-binding protein/sulfopyruvate decarboxylase TPP-binding subunit